MHKKLVLEDGLVFEGRSFGSDEDVSGEVIFSTAMTDYQGLLTDPSICGQIVCMTFPLIGNYGINRFDSESLQPWIGALLVRELCDAPNNFRMESKLNDYLVRNNIPGLEGIDTRMLTRHLREKGRLKGSSYLQMYRWRMPSLVCTGSRRRMRRCLWYRRKCRTAYRVPESASS